MFPKARTSLHIPNHCPLARAGRSVPRLAARPMRQHTYLRWAVPHNAGLIPPCARDFGCGWTANPPSGAALVSPPGPRLGAAAMSWKHDAPPNGLRRLPGAECANRLHAQFLGGTTGTCYFRRGAGAIRRHRGVRGRAGCNGGAAAAASTVTMFVAA